MWQKWYKLFKFSTKNLLNLYLQIIIILFQVIPLEIIYFVTMVQFQQIMKQK